MSIKTASVSLKTYLALRYKGPVRDCRCCIIWNQREIGVTELNKNTHQGKAPAWVNNGNILYCRPKWRCG